MAGSGLGSQESRHSPATRGNPASADKSAVLPACPFPNS